MNPCPQWTQQRRAACLISCHLQSVHETIYYTIMKKTEEKPNSEEAPDSYQHTEENLGEESTVSRRL